MTTGHALRDQGQADVLAADTAPHRGYADLIAEAVSMFGKVDTDFDAEAVRRYVRGVYPDARPHSPNVIGATLGGMAAAGHIVAVGFRSSSRPSSRARILRIWRVTQTPPVGATPAAAGVEGAGAAVRLPTPAAHRPPADPST